MRGLSLGRVFGTEVKAHWSWILILAFVAVVFGVDLSDGSAASWPVGLAWTASIATAALVFASVTIHELAHVKVARQNGQTLPSVSVQLLGGPYVMEVKPATPGAELRIALAGPALSLLVAIVLGCVAGLMVFGPLNIDNPPDGLQAIGFVTTMVAAFNMALCVINLVPGYPLDGARALHALVWYRTGSELTANAAAIRIGRYVGIALIMAGALSLAALDPAAGLCLIVGGWLVMSSSRFLDRRSVLQGLIAGLRVSDAEETQPARVPPQLTLDVFAGEYLGERLGAAALVERGSELLGLIGTAQVRRIPRRNWTVTRTEQAMVRIGNVPSVTGDTDLWSALEVLERTGLDALLVSGDPSTTTGADPALDASNVDGVATESEPVGRVILTRRSAAKLVHERAEERHREILAQGLIKKNRFGGR